MKNPKPESLGTLTQSGFTCRNPRGERASSASALVAQVFNLPYRRFSTCAPLRNSRPPRRFGCPADCKSAIQQISNLRYAASVACLVLLGVAVAHAQTNCTIDWFTVDGGGGTSTGGVYSVSGTIGQPDAGGPMTNGQYSVIGGFWALFAVQTEGAPILSIVPAGLGQATISWTPPTPGFVLQESLSLSPPAWTNSPSGATNPVVVPAALPTKFYRLHKPG